MENDNVVTDEPKTRRYGRALMKAGAVAALVGVGFAALNKALDKSNDTVQS